MSGFEPLLSCSQNGPGAISRSVLDTLPISLFVAGEEVIVPWNSLQRGKGINRNHAMSSPKCNPPVINNQTAVRRFYRLPRCARKAPLVLLGLHRLADGHLSVLD